MMEIAKMGQEISRQEFDMKKEAHEFGMQKAQFDQQQKMSEHFTSLMQQAKRSKAMTQYDQMLTGGAQTPDMNSLAGMFLREGYVPQAQETAMMTNIQKGMEPEERKPLSTVGKLVDDMNNLPPDSPFRETYRKALEKAVARTGQKIEVGADGSVTITQGEGAMESPLSKPTQTQIEKDTLALSTQLGDLAALKDNYSREYLTYGGRLKGWSLRQQSKAGFKLGKESKGFVGGMRQFVEGVEQIFNTYRKEITGAQAAMKEIAMLRTSILNKEMSPDEFEYSYNRYVSQIGRQFRLKTKFLREGITNPKELGKRIDQAYLNNENTDSKDMDMRGDEIASELIKRGVPQEQLQQEVLSMLKKEGYY